MRFEIALPDTAPFVSGPLFRDVAISPGGTQIVYSGGIAGPQINLRSNNEVVGAPLPGAEGGVGPFFSPDGEWVGFYSNGGNTLNKVSIFGGPPVMLADLPGLSSWASWDADDQIIVGMFLNGLFRVPAGGGEPEVLTTLTQGERAHQAPFVIPGRAAVLFVIRTAQGRQLAVLDLDTGDVARLGLTGFGPHYVSTGHLVFVAEDQSLRAVPFDAASLQVTGNPVPMVSGVEAKAGGAANFSISDNGRLVYAEGGGVAPRSLVWVDREGREDPIAAPLRDYVYARISPDGSQVALELQDDDDDIWILDVNRENLRRLTLDGSSDNQPLWTPDGGRIVFQSGRAGINQLFWKAADGTGATERLLDAEVDVIPNVVSPDGSLLIFRERHPTRGYDLSTLALDGNGATETLLGTEFNELNTEISPDGRWLAYQTDASGQVEIYVRPFPTVDGGGLWLISTSGGVKPMWGPDGRELFYMSGQQLLAVEIRAGADFDYGPPRALFGGDYFTGRPGRNHDVARTGDRFLMIKNDANEQSFETPEINVVVNWLEELKRLVPVD